MNYHSQPISYRLELSTTQSWDILAERPVHAWAERFASILKLEEGTIGGCPRLIFKKRETDRILESSGKEILRLENLTIRFCSEEPDVICEVPSENPDLLGIWESIYPIYYRAQRAGGLPIHAGLIEKSGQGILVAGESNSGKSTCCRRIPPPWKVHCDEETLVLPDMDRKGYLAHPFPTWSRFVSPRDHFSWDVKRAVPLRAIFFLEKADTDTTQPLGPGRAAMNIFAMASEKCHMDWARTDSRERICRRSLLIENACRMADSVPAFVLKVSRFGRFWEWMDKALAK